MKASITIAILLGASTASAQAVRHVPPGDAEAGKPLELIAEAAATTPTLVAHVRAHGSTTYKPIELVRRDDAHWVAVVPADTVEPPGIDYYLDAGDQPVFASADWPHTMTVRSTPEDERRGRDLMRAHGRRSKLNTTFDWVEYGRKTYGMTKLDDNYYRVDGDFSYRLLAYPLEEIRIGGTYMIGQTLAAADQPCPTSEPCTNEAGVKAGWFELGLAAVEGVRLDARMIAMATAEGFAIGGRGEARLGARDASHVAIGAEYLADVGSNGFFRLGWGKVPRLPMSATVEVTNLPASNRATGVRLYYDVAREVAPGVRLGLRVGYAARYQSVAGFTGGAGASVEF
ncbi:MAG TPA: hypothetical protein VIV40_12760 [Kofleriaceae bacterium]